MSMEAIRWAWTVPTSATCKLVLVRLADAADAAGCCFPSLHRIEEETGLTMRGARKAIAALERRGLVRRDYRPSTSTMYRLAVGTIGTEEQGSVRNVVPPGTAFRRNTVPVAPERGSARTLIEPKEERSLLRSDAPAAADTSGQIASAPFNARKLVWTEGIAILRRLTGKPEGAARSLMGKLLSAAKDDCAVVLTALRECPDTRAPTAWLMGAAKARSNPKRSMTEINREDWNLPTFADPSLLDDEPRGMLAA
jgi:DNA-binding transcriptional ArsR family regulator